MGVFKNIKSLFFVEETPENTPTQEPPKNSVNNVPPAPEKGSSLPPIPPPNPPMAQAGSVDQRIADALIKAMEDNNIQGFDFFEYRQSVKALEGIPMDEATRYRSAFATAATMGVTLDKLLQSGDYYQQILDKEKSKFEEALGGHAKQGVSEREKEVSRIEQEIASKSEQIKLLTEEIAKLQEAYRQQAGAIAEAKAKIDATRLNFETTYNVIYSQIQEQIDKIKTHLK